MFGLRDLVWSSVICAMAVGYLQCRPAFSARRFIEREAEAGFVQAFAGHRLADGDLITAKGQGAHADPMAPMVMLHRVEIEAERLSWNGKKAEFVVLHRVELDEEDASREIYVRIEKQGRRWVYMHFEVRGAGELPEPNASNPWARALRPS